MEKLSRRCRHGSETKAENAKLRLQRIKRQNETSKHDKEIGTLKSYLPPSHQNRHFHFPPAPPASLNPMVKRQTQNQPDTSLHSAKIFIMSTGFCVQKKTLTHGNKQLCKKECRQRTAAHNTHLHLGRTTHGGVPFVLFPGTCPFSTTESRDTPSRSISCDRKWRRHEARS